MGDSDNEDSQIDKTMVTSDTFKGRLAAADNAPPSLIMLMGPPGYVGQQWVLNGTDLVIGRAVESFVYVDDKSLSKSHAKLSVVGNEVTIMDLNSTNKTVINGAAIPALSPFKIKNNDQIKAGNVIFKFLEQGNIETVTNQDVLERAQKDALTGAYSKGALLIKGPEAMKRAEVINEPLSLIVFDIDFFKRINDSYGHPAGDYVLRELSAVVMKKLIRSQDYLARYGGEEFVIILSGSPLKSALEIAERVRTTVEGHKFTFEGRSIPVTISLGVAVREPAEAEWAHLFKRADQALFTSKSNGRNRVSLA